MGDVVERSAGLLGTESQAGQFTSAFGIRDLRVNDRNGVYCVEKVGVGVIGADFRQQ